MLGNSISLTSKPKVCNSYLHYISINNGVVCYNGTDVGSRAVYFCFSCSQNSTELSLVRICQPHGEWNGTVHQCQLECSKYYSVLNSWGEGGVGEYHQTHYYCMNIIR